MSIENPTLVHFRHFSSLFTNFPSTTVEKALQIRLFMQNKAKFRKSQMNVSTIITRGYKNKTRLRPPKKQSQTNPNKANYKKAEMNVTSYITVGYENKPPIWAPKKQSQFPKRQKPMQTYLPQRIMKKTAISGSDKTKPNKPNLSRRSLWRSRIKANIMPKQTLFQTAYLLIDRARPEFLNFLLKKPQIPKITYKAGACLCRFVYKIISLNLRQGQAIIKADFY